MNNEKKQLVERLKMNELAMDQAMVKLLAAMKTKNDTEIYISLSELLYWIANTHEWHDKKTDRKFSEQLKQDEIGVLLLGLRHANNMIKHNFNLIHEHQLVHLRRIPQTIPFYATAEYCWLEAGKEFEGAYPNQKKNYDRFIAGKGILSTCRKAIQYLQQENKKFM